VNSAFLWNDAAKARPYSGFAFDVARGRCRGGRMILLQQRAMALVRPWSRDLQRPGDFGAAAGNDAVTSVAEG